MLDARQILVIDCHLAGVSGDMILGALFDLGVNIVKVTEAIKSTKNFVKGCKSLEITVDEVSRGGFRAKRVCIEAEETFNHRTGIDLRKAVLECTESLNLSDEAKNLALNSIDTLVNAEAKVHGEDVDQVHLAEAGSVDTIADVIGTVAALEDLNLYQGTKIFSTPVAVGGGLFKFSRGSFSSPAPATIEILTSKSFPIIGGPIQAELATPTGVSLLVNMVDKVTQVYPPMKPKVVGYGAGARDIKEIPNVLRVLLGETSDCELLTDEICVLETNLDDATGEIIGHVVDKLSHPNAGRANHSDHY